MSSPITTHVLDLRTGKPATGLSVKLEQQRDDGIWQSTGSGVTNDDGRVTDLLSSDSLQAAVHRITFATAEYFKSVGAAGFYPEVTVTFRVCEPTEHYHVPLLLSPFGYSTYRGS